MVIRYGIGITDAISDDNKIRLVIWFGKRFMIPSFKHKKLYSRSFEEAQHEYDIGIISEYLFVGITKVVNE
jgi:hypothetical protein